MRECNLGMETVCQSEQALAAELWVRIFLDGLIRHLRSIRIENPSLWIPHDRRKLLLRIITLESWFESLEFSVDDKKNIFFSFFFAFQFLFFLRKRTFRNVGPFLNKFDHRIMGICAGFHGGFGWVFSGFFLRPSLLIGGHISLKSSSHNFVLRAWTEFEWWDFYVTLFSLIPRPIFRLNQRQKNPTHRSQKAKGTRARMPYSNAKVDFHSNDQRHAVLLSCGIE